MNRLFFSSLVFLAAFFIHPSVAVAQKGYNNKLLAIEILKLVNDHRAGKGLGPLKMNDIISQAAEKHSGNMASGKIPFGHDGFDERMARVTKQLKPANAWAENVAYGSHDAKEIVDMWLHSPGHKKNIEGDYNLSGIGIAKGTDGNYYYTQIFINKG